MEFYDVLKARRSIRGYLQKDVPDDSLAKIMEAVRLAPTACNKQPFKILLVKNSGTREKICGVYTQKWLAQAPVIAVALANESQAWHRLEGDSAANIDVSIAMEHFVLAAAEEGLGTCWICAFNRLALDLALEIAPPWKSFAISPLGYANAEPRNNLSKSVDELFEVIN